MRRNFSLFLLAICETGISGSAHAANEAALPALEVQLRASALFQAAAPESAGDAAASGPRWGGARLYGSTGLANVNEVVDIGRRRSYQQLSANVGVLWPLLGSRLALDEQMRERGIATLQLQLDTETQRRQALTELRHSYIEYWAAQQRARLASDFLAQQPKLEEVLRQRTAAGLLLESDRLEFLSALERVALELQDARTAPLAAGATLRRLLARPLDDTELARPNFDSSCKASPALLEVHPELQWLQALARRAQASPRSSELYPWHSDIRIGYARSHEPDSGQNGGSGIVSWSFDYPIGERDVWRSERARLRTEARRAGENYEHRRQELLDQLQELQQRETLAAASLRLSRLALSAATARVHERQLRANKLAGDVIEQLQQARYQQYRAAIAELDAQQHVYESNNALTPLIVANCAAMTQHLGRGLYLWSSQRFVAQLAAGEAPGLLARLNSLQIERVYLALDAAQIKAASEDPSTLRAALAAAAIQGVQIELLLGEPTWMLPHAREKLLQLIDELRHFSFAGLHLDLEPSQLDASGGPGAQILPELLATLRVVRERSPWPLSLSLHHRDLAAVVEGKPFAEQLQQLDIQPTLMIYSADTERVAMIAGAALQRWPLLRARVAVSMEPELDDSASFARLAPAERERRWRVIESALSDRQLVGLVIQPGRTWLYDTQ